MKYFLKCIFENKEDEFFSHVWLRLDMPSSDVKIARSQNQQRNNRFFGAMRYLIGDLESCPYSQFRHPSTWSLEEEMSLPLTPAMSEAIHLRTPGTSWLSSPMTLPYWPFSLKRISKKDPPRRCFESNFAGLSSGGRNNWPLHPVARKAPKAQQVKNLPVMQET